MSWEIFIQDWGNVQSLDEIPDNFKPNSIGDRSSIIKKIKSIEPTIDFSNPAFGIIKNNHFSIELNLGDNEDLMSIQVQIRGNELSIPCIANILTN